jgi:hypothetical protein
MPESKQRTIVYVDGFNLYYGALKDRPNRWLDLAALSQHLLKPTHALATIPNLSIHFGHFLTRKANRRLVRPPRRGSSNRQVWNTEEKGSDVNLASYLLIDGFRARYDIAVVISNDSDLKTPVEFVREDLGAPVGILNPHKNRSWALSPKQLPKGSFYKPIRSAALAASQLPPTLTDADGTIHKPKGW